MRENARTRFAIPLPDEQRLVQKAKSGDPNAFARLYDAYVDRIYRYVYFRVSDDVTAEDITSQVFLKSWETLDRYRVGSSPYLSWLYTIARNLVIDHYRTRKEESQLDDAVSLTDGSPGPADVVQEKFDIEAMRDALRFLTDEQQQVLVMRFMDGLPTEDIAAIMGKREGAIRALQMRALQALSRYMTEKEHESDR